MIRDKETGELGCHLKGEGGATEKWGNGIEKRNWCRRATV